jgi:hypothetical protein
MRSINKKLTDDELLDALNSDVEAPIVYNSEFIRFLETFKIRSGTQKVKIRLLYDLYNKWSLESMTAENFGHKMGDLFEISKSGPNTFILINMESIEILKFKEQVKPKVTKIVSQRFKKNFEAFIEKYEIERGTLFLKSITLYDLYDKWCYRNGNKINPLNINVFNSFAELYFTKKMDKNYLYFGVSEKVTKHLNNEQKLLSLTKKAQQNAKKKAQK